MDEQEARIIIRQDAPHLLHELNSLASTSEPNLQEIIRTVKQHPVMARSVLHEANAARNAPIRRIKTIEHAVVYLGPRGVGRLALRLLEDPPPDVVAPSPVRDRSAA
ncbi:MAG: HDOD domain-containing protein [Planctomycetales bacterium]|nr:HDOD domain-containing protein [Planctomycetales bacterium]